MISPARGGLVLRDRRFDWGARTYVMGIVNVSPESFSGDGLSDASAAVRQALQMQADGADIIDVGGQSTRPAPASPATGGFEELGVAEEIERAVPAIEAILRAVDIPVSIDSYRAPVVEAALGTGASLVNDVSGFRDDPEVAALAARFGVPAVAMHNQRGREPGDVIARIAEGWNESLRIAEAAGLPRDQIVLDPGFGFGWAVEDNLAMIARLGELREFGLPLLVGTSRKNTIGEVLGRPAGEREWGTAATVALSIANGADIVRVHDVAEMKQVCLMADAVVRGRREG